MNNYKSSYPKPSVLSNKIISPVSILIMSTIKTKKVHPHGVMTMDMYFDHITEVVQKAISKDEDKESSDTFSKHYNYYNYYKNNSFFITTNMNNMKTLPITLMSKQETKQVSNYIPYIKSVEFTEGVQKTFFVIEIRATEQSFKGVVKMENFKTIDLATGKGTKGTRPLKGYELTLVDKNDPDKKARMLSVNKSEGVAFIDQMVKDRAEPIDTFIAGEEITLERVQNDFGYNPSILPVGA